MQGEPGALSDKQRALDLGMRAMQAEFRRDAAYREADEIKKDIKRLAQQLYSHRVYRVQLIARTGGGTRELTG